ncbi:MAG: gamma-glutamyl-gamma-aminobutyrate hydrolase family protein [Clostridia bacterium]|nr:gamma-glutamyl-gamma-aminobutyrate hydrolase family protein [Clostridia bacterium]
MKPLIGLVPLFDSEKNSLWMIPGYMDGVHGAGGIPVMLPLTADADDIRTLVKQMDGFILTGGQDVDPALYGEAASDRCGEISKARDAMEYALLREALGRGKPVLGICRGIQLMNAYFGGTLYQDIPTQCPSGVTHQMEPPYDRGVHEVYINKGSLLHAVTGEETLSVNSYHHQGIKTLGRGLTASAKAADGIIEAAEKTDARFVLAVQWHPELDFHKSEASRRIFGALVGAAGKIK